jgi:Uma2 family endonuclease
LAKAWTSQPAVVDQGKKRATYARSGVPWYWLVEPTNRTLTVLQLSADGYVVQTVVGERDRTRLPPFDDIEIDLEAIFPPIPEAE